MFTTHDISRYYDLSEVHYRLFWNLKNHVHFIMDIGMHLQKNFKAIKTWASGWAINDFNASENFYSYPIKAGFDRVRIEDASEAIKPSAKRLYHSYFMGKPAAAIYRFFNRKVTSLASNNVETAYQQYKTLNKGLCKYGIVKLLSDKVLQFYF